MCGWDRRVGRETCLWVQGCLQVESGDDERRRLLLPGALGTDILVALHLDFQLAPAHLMPRSASLQYELFARWGSLDCKKGQDHKVSLTVGSLSFL